MHLIVRNSIPSRCLSLKRQRGLTLIELLVAMAVGLIVVLAAVGSLMAARSGFTAVDAGSQLRENGRFSADLIQRIVTQGGYDDLILNAATKRCGTSAGFSSACEDREPDVSGFNNAVFEPSATSFPPTVTNDSRNTVCTGFSDTSCANGADVLIVRFQGSSLPNTTTADGSIISCTGAGEPAPTAGNAESRAYAVFHVSRNSLTGEPDLMCSYRDTSTGQWMHARLVPGVETFQVLFGMDYGAGAVGANAATTGTGDSVADRYLRADQIPVAGNVSASRANWRRVRSVRIGLVVRGPVGSATTAGVTTAPTYRPFGNEPSNAQGNSSDPGTLLTPPIDGRLRQVVTLTVHLRNRLELD